MPHAWAGGNVFVVYLRMLPVSWGIQHQVAMTVNGKLGGIRKGMAVVLFLVLLSERTEENHQKNPESK